MIGHQISFPEPSPEEQRSGVNVIIECETCHSPDEFGDGAARFSGFDEAEAWDKFEQHVEAAEED